jgi:hypothetical protein
MSPTLTEHAGTGISPPVKPSVWRLGWAAFLGYLFTFLGGLPLVFLMLAVGIDVLGGEGRGAFERYDVWSWLAEACLGLLATSVTAWAVAWQLRERTGWEVPLSFTFFTLLLTGYAPLLALTPFYWATAPVSLAAATLILRWRCEPAGAEPLRTLGGVPRRYRRPVAIALAVAGPLMLAYLIAYAATHPLRAQHGYSRDGLVNAHDPGKLSRYSLFLENNGPAAVKDLSIVGVEGTPALQLERVGIEARRWTVPPGGPFAPPLRPLDTRGLLVGDAEDAITLELRQGRVCPSGVSKLEAIRVRYTVFGTTQEQRIPLEEPPGVRCP